MGPVKPRPAGVSQSSLPLIGGSKPDLPAVQSGPSKELNAQTDKAKLKIAESALAQSGAVSAQAMVTTLESQIGNLKREQKELQTKAGNPFDPAGAMDAAKKLGDVGKKLGQLETGLKSAKATLKAAKEGAIAGAKSAIAEQQAANRMALLEFRLPPFPQVKELASLAKQPTADQQKVLGHAVTAVPVEEAVAESAARFKAAKTPYDAAVIVQREFQMHPEPEFQAALWNEVKGQLPKLAKEATGHTPTMRSLVAIAEHGGVDVERDIARALAKEAPKAVIADGTMYAAADPFLRGPVGNLKTAIKETGRLDLAHRLVEELNAAGKPQAASAVASAAAGELKALRTDFESKQKKVDTLNAKLGMLVAGFGPMMTDDQKRKAIEAFQLRHTDDFKAHEAAGKKLAQGLTMAAEIAGSSPKNDGQKALKKEAEAVLKLSGVIANTKAGEAELKAAMAKEAKGESSWVSTAMEYAQTVKDGEKIAGTLGTAVMRNLALDATKLFENNPGAALSKVESISHYAKLMGIDPAKADNLSTAMVGMLKGRPEAGKALEKAVLDVEGTPLIPPDGAFSKTLKGVGVALSVYSLGKNGLGDNAIDQLKNINAGLNVGADALSLGLSIVGRGEALKNFAEGASKKLGVLGAAFDLTSGARSLFKGDFAEAGTSFASSAGALLMLTPGGQIPGALLTVGSMIAGMVFASRKANAAEAADEADAKAFLVAAGVDENVAAPLSDLLQKNRRNVGPFLSQLETHLKLKPGELLKLLNKPELAGKLKELVVIIKDIEPRKDGTYATRTDNDAQAKKSGYKHLQLGPNELDFRPKSLEAVTDWMKEKKLLGGA